MLFLLSILADVFLLGFTIYFFIYPLAEFVTILSILYLAFIVVYILLLSNGKKSVLRSSIAICHLCIIIPLMPFLYIRYLSVLLNNVSLCFFLATSVVLIIPITVYEISITIFDWNKIEYNTPNKPEILHKIGWRDNLSVVSLIFSFTKAVLLFGITFSDYIEINIAYERDIYAGIVFSIAYDAFLTPLLHRIRMIREKKRLNNCQKVSRDNLDSKRKVIEDCYRESKGETLNVNKFLDLLSFRQGGLTMSDIQKIDRNTYILLKLSCESFFKEYPYESEERITVTHLYVWSEDKSLNDIPIKSLSF